MPSQSQTGNPPGESFKIFALWLAALFLIAFGAQLWIAWLYGSPVPIWDDWAEASFFKSWAAGDLRWTDYFAPHNEHRIFATRLLDIGLIWANGRWEPLLEMAVNAFIHAAFAGALAFCLWEFLGRARGWLICALLVPFYALPYAGENALCGFNSQDYFVNIFALAALAGLGLGKPGGWSWWLGVATAILGLFNMASGLLAPLATGGLIVLRAIKNRRLDRANVISLGVCILLSALGVALNVTDPADQLFEAHSFTEFTAALTRNLSWPFYNAPFMPGLMVLPLALLLAFYFRPNFSQPRAAEFLLLLALWSVLQSIVLAYGRANYGGTFPVSRYMDWFNILAIAAVFASLLLSQLWEQYRIRSGILAFIFIGIVLFGLCRISQIVVTNLLVPSCMWNLVAEERVQTYMTTGNGNDLLEHPTVRPDPRLALTALHDPVLRPILPASCWVPASAPKAGRFAPLTDWLLQHSLAILCAGLFLFIGFCIYGLARGALGMSARNPAGMLALLAGLAALGFVWSKHTVSRESVEYRLEQEIAANFKTALNLKRAAIHEQKAEELKQFAN